MKEYTAQEMKDNPITGWFWARFEDATVYENGPYGVRLSASGWICTPAIPSCRIRLKDMSGKVIFYGPIERPGVPE